MIANRQCFVNNFHAIALSEKFTRMKWPSAELGAPAPAPAPAPYTYVLATHQGQFQVCLGEKYVVDEYSSPPLWWNLVTCLGNPSFHHWFISGTP